MKNEIEQKLIDYLKPIFSEIDELSEVKIINADDFTEDRESFMVVVGITDSTRVHYGLNDFEFKLSIVVDTFIEDDELGYNQNNISMIISETIFKYINNLSEIFDELPVVGVVEQPISFSKTDISHRTEMTYLIYTSQ